MIFWRSVPDYYLEKDENEIENYEREAYDLIIKIIQNFRTNKFKKSRIKYNPNEDFDFGSYQDEIKKWNLPQELIQPTNGMKPIYLGTTLKFLRNQYVKSKKRKHKK